MRFLVLSSLFLGTLAYLQVRTVRFDTAVGVVPNLFSVCACLCVRQVVRVRPNDKDAKMKYQECNKIVKQKAFERAIASDEHKKSVVDSLDIENMSEFGLRDYDISEKEI